MNLSVAILGRLQLVCRIFTIRMCTFIYFANRPGEMCSRLKLFLLTGILELRTFPRALPRRKSLMPPA